MTSGFPKARYVGFVCLWLPLVYELYSPTWVVFQVQLTDQCFLADMTYLYYWSVYFFSVFFSFFIWIFDPRWRFGPNQPRLRKRVA